MTSEEIRQSFLEFFEKKGHKIIPSSSLIPENDPTVLLTTAGMHPLVPYLMGEKHPAGQRLANCQKCIRTSDIDKVGDTTHHTFFEMLGNWSLGNYFKKEAIEWSWEFLTGKEWLNLDKNRLAVSVFVGDSDAPFDEESFNIWKNLGVSEKRIAKLPKKNNWWGPAGETGPCGPDTEMFYWAGDADKVPEGFNDDNVSWVEIWNDVFMQFNKKADGTFETLKQQNVDTGMGLERTLAALNGFDDNYRTELFWPLIKKIEELFGKKYGDSLEITRAMRIIADHLKAAALILGDEKGLMPSNVGAGYVLRRLIRRAVRNGFSLGIKETFTSKIAEEVIKIYQEVYPELKKNKEFIINQLAQEEKKFKKTLENGLKEFDKIFRSLSSDEDKKFFYIGGKDFFNLYQTYGFPVELSIEEYVCRRNKLGYTPASEEIQKLWTEEVHKKMLEHQKLSRTASAGMFKGGLADASERTIKYHTAAHLTLAALRKVLGEGVLQKGSNITSERLRFDFSYPEKMTSEQIKQVEDLINEKIKEDLPVICEEMNLEDAKNQGAMGVFDQKYGERVKVYTIGNPSTGDFFSKEICGGPHVNCASEIGKFKILKEEAVGTGVRRIRGIINF
ncbi:MAG: alanine--tRNA ligase [bacterium]|nr:alanine--tRNA ligase [bacterium]